MQNHWLWLAVGIIPYSVKRQHMKDEQSVRIRAMFWHLTIHWQQGRCSWEVSLPLIEHWRQ